LLLPELKANIQFLIARGVQGAMVLGSTGEFLYFDCKARERILAEAVELLAPLPAIANITDIRPSSVATLGRFARKCGAAAVALLPPYFYPVAQADLVEWFVRAGEAAGLPIFLYNFPERTGNRIALDTIAAVADRIALAGVKQSGADFEYHRALAQLGREKNFAVLTGTDTRLVEAMQIGATGCVSGLANAVPEPLVDIFNAVKASAPERAVSATERMKAIGNLVEQVEFPLNVAAIIQARGLAAGHSKSLVSAVTQARYQRLIQELQSLFRQWRLGF
jgi:4-hydroxy-tetrahydrodipicolinate synthase